MMIVSASRRTDIPGYYSEWFINRLREGYVLTRNPMNRTQVKKIILSLEEVDCFVFWTKDPENMMDRLPVIDEMGYPYYFQFTITPYGKTVERNLREKKEILNTFRQLSNRIGKERTLLRYDPILLNDEFTIQYHQDKFTELCRELQGYTDICTISFVDLYYKLNKSVKEGLIREITEEQMHGLAAILAGVGREHGIELRTCCERVDFSKEGILPAACVDQKIIERITGHNISLKKDKNQRSGCGCMQSVDIGAYNTCNNGCIYCYANYSEASINKNFQMHNKEAEILL